MKDYTVSKWRDLTQYTCTRCHEVFLADPGDIRQRQQTAKKSLFEHLFDAHGVLIELNEIPDAPSELETLPTPEPVPVPDIPTLPASGSETSGPPESTSEGA